MFTYEVTLNDLVNSNDLRTGTEIVLISTNRNYKGVIRELETGGIVIYSKEFNLYSKSPREFIDDVKL